MAQLQPWIIDAIDIDPLDEVDEFRQRLFCETFAISQFLSQTGESRDSRFLVVAPKGYGKTLIIKAKRVLIAKGNQDYLLLPQDSLVDRPGGSPPLFSLDDAAVTNDLQYWKTAWSCAICISVIHSTEPEFFITSKSDFLKSLGTGQLKRTTTDIFASILYLNNSERFRVMKFYNDLVIPKYRTLHRPIAIFIDNVDEYFSPQLSKESLQVGGQQDRQRWIWVLAQVGLAEAIRSLRSINPHIKVFAALRKEALVRGFSLTPNTRQLQGISLELQYKKADLLEIFRKNIDITPTSRMSDPDEVDSIARFVGSHNKEIRHKFTGKTESFFSFLARHTLGRPRDIMAIGEALMRIDPPRSEEAVRQAVFEGARNAVLEHFQDMKPFIPVPGLDVFKFVTKNVLSERELEKASSKYVNYTTENGIKTNGHPFCALYRLGLIGILDGDYSSKNAKQKFPEPDNMPMDANEHILPKATKYLIHPALDDLINESHGGHYRMNFERINVIGNGLEWKDSNIARYLIKGDIVGYSDIMHSPEYKNIYPRVFESWTKASCEGIEYFNISGGDSVIMIDGSPTTLIAAAQSLCSKVRSFLAFPREMRFGASDGPIEFHPDEKGGIGNPDGLPLRTAARLEPLAKVGTLWSTEGFATAAIGFGWDVNKIRTLTPVDLPGTEFKEGKFYIKKKESDPPVITGLWQFLLED